MRQKGRKAEQRRLCDLLCCTRGPEARQPDIHPRVAKCLGPIRYRGGEHEENRREGGGKNFGVGSSTVVSLEIQRFKPEMFDRAHITERRSSIAQACLGFCLSFWAEIIVPVLWRLTRNYTFPCPIREGIAERGYQVNTRCRWKCVKGKKGGCQVVKKVTGSLGFTLSLSYQLPINFWTYDIHQLYSLVTRHLRILTSLIE